MRRIHIDIPRADHSYDIRFETGLHQAWRQEVETLLPASRYLVLADSEVARLYGMPASGTADGNWRYLRVQAGESHKNLAQYQSVMEQALTMGLDRKSVVTAVGGGVTGDLGGFIAATLYRGVRLVMVPTTLLSQVDSSVGGKNGVNTASGKNLVGTFHQPSLVLIDPAYLDSLPEREYLAGLAEVIKTAVLASGELFDLLRRSADLILARDHELLADIIAQCCQIKADVVAADERESGKRALLNLGHTFGHALEARGGFDGTVVHGEAVAVGLALAAGYSAAEGWLSKKDRDDIVALLRALRQPVSITDLAAAGKKPDWPALLAGKEVEAALLSDKKTTGGKLNLVLPKAVGVCTVEKGIAVEKAAEFMRRSIAG